MIFRLTARAKKQINLMVVEKSDKKNDKQYMDEWNIDITNLHGKKYFIMTENKTLFTIIRHAVDVDSVESFEKFFSEMLKYVFESFIEDIEIPKIDLGKCIYTGTENNNVRRAQIDSIYHANRIIESGGNTYEINNYPVSSIGFKMPSEYFISELDMYMRKGAFTMIKMSKN